MGLLRAEGALKHGWAHPPLLRRHVESSGVGGSKLSPRNTLSFCPISVSDETTFRHYLPRHSLSPFPPPLPTTPPHKEANRQLNGGVLPPTPTPRHDTGFLTGAATRTGHLSLSSPSLPVLCLPLPSTRSLSALAKSPSNHSFRKRKTSQVPFTSNNSFHFRSRSSPRQPVCGVHMLSYRFTHPVPHGSVPPGL